jgi:hypothetical protein
MVKNRVGTELLKLPVAAASGVSWLRANPGTRGITKTRIIPALNVDGREQSAPVILRGGVHNSRYTQPKDKEDSEPPGKPTPTHASLSPPPILPLLTPGFSLPLLLTAPAHVVQFRSLPLGTKSRDSNHFYVCSCGTGGIIMLETSTGD